MLMTLFLFSILSSKLKTFIRNLISFIHPFNLTGRLKILYLAFFRHIFERKGGLFITSAYWKLKFTIPYTNWNSFLRESDKINLISVLAHHALMIFSSCKHYQELENIHCFCYNGYPANIIKRVVVRKFKRFNDLVVFGPDCVLFIKNYHGLLEKVKCLLT